MKLNDRHWGRGGKIWEGIDKKAKGGGLGLKKKKKQFSYK